MPTTQTSSNDSTMTYAQTGVDIDAGDEVVKLIKPLLRKTYGPRVLGATGGFAGMFRLDYNEKLFKKNYRDPVLVACADGVGTKVKLAAEMGIYNTVGIDCVAMNVNDLIVQGAEPLFFLDYLGLNKIVPKETAAIVEGVAKGCEIAGCALIGGECSEMPDVYAKGDFDVAGFAVGVVPLKRAIDPTRVEQGDIIIGLASDGIHSNGFSLVRAIIKQRKLNLDKIYPELSKKTLGEELLVPTRIYAKAIVKLLAKYKVKRVVSGMAHITGGGLPGNVIRALPEKMDAVINTKAWPGPPIFDFLQTQGNIDQDEMYKVFNMGVGYTLIVRPTFAESVVKQLNSLGEKAFIMGKITKGKGEVKLQ